MSQRQTSTPMGGDELLIALVIVVGVLTFGIWSGAQLAVVDFDWRVECAGIGDGFSALLRSLPSNFDDPASASPAPVGPSIPGVWSTGRRRSDALLVEMMLVAWAWVRLTLFESARIIGSGWEWLSALVWRSEADMHSLFVPGPIRGRFIFGCFNGQLIATEHPLTSQTLVQPWGTRTSRTRRLGQRGRWPTCRSCSEGETRCTSSRPLKDASRYAVVFGGLLGSLLRDQAYDVANRYRKPLPGLLCVIDEAGNTPLRWLPEVASTCSGIGVQLVTAWQSKAQIDATYQAQSGPMSTNHATKIFFAGASDVETLRYVTFLGGEEEVQQRSANADALWAAIGAASATRRSIDHCCRLKFSVSRTRQRHPLHQTLPPAHIEGRYVGSDGATVSPLPPAKRSAHPNR